MTHYYYIDDANEEVSEYDDFDDFMDGILWNRDVAEEYGDEVLSEEELIEEINSAVSNNEEYCSDPINGAYFKISSTAE